MTGKELKESELKITSRLTSERIQEIEKNGETASTLVEAARNPSNPLHDLFEWDNSVAAEKYRLHQARVLINTVKVIIEGEIVPAYENVRVKVEGTDDYKRVYKPVYEIIDNKELRDQILKTALAHFEYWKKQYSRYEEFKPIISSAERVKRKLNKKWLKKKQ